MLLQEISEGVLYFLDIPTLSLGRRQHNHGAIHAAWSSWVSLRHPRVLRLSDAQQLSRDERRIVQWAVARNRRTPVAILAEMAGDSDPGICQAVAAHPSADKAARVDAALAS